MRFKKISAHRLRAVSAPTLLALLAACGNNPQQPSAEVDDRAAESPYLGGSEQDTTAATTPDFSFEDPADMTTGSISSTVPNTAPVDGSAIIGRWAADPAWCADETAGAAVAISESRFEAGLEGGCDIVELIDGGDGSVTATLSCGGDSAENGGLETELLRLIPQGETLKLDYLARDEPETTLTRCP